MLKFVSTPREILVTEERLVKFICSVFCTVLFESMALVVTYKSKENSQFQTVSEAFLYHRLLKNSDWCQS